jgi:hypothetical protein
MLELEVAPEPALASPASVPLERSVVLVRASLERVLAALEPFAREGPIDATPGLGRGQGLDDLLPATSKAQGRRAVAYRRRGASEVSVIREGPARAAHDVPLARRLSRELGAPAVALHVAAGEVAYDLFHDGSALERLLSSGGSLSWAESRFDLDPREVARDPYGRALALLRAYGLADDRLGFDDFARGTVMLRRWDVTIDRCFGWGDLAAWPA